MTAKEPAKFLSILLMFLILNSSFAFAETNVATGTDGTQGNSSAEPAVPSSGTDTTAPETKDTVKTAEFACKNPSTYPLETMLLPQEVERLKQGLQNLGVLNGK